MISSFFSKTKPINYIVLSVFVFLFYCFFVFYGTGYQIDIDAIPLQILTVGVLLFSVYMINKIVRIEKVTDFSSYTPLFFVLLLVGFSDVLLHERAIFCNFFLLLAVWRLLGVKSMKNVKHKIFDASFLICIASLFYNWALIFLILVFAVINVYDRKIVKNWMVPVVAILTVFLLSSAVLAFDENLSFFWEHYSFSIDFLMTGFFGKASTIKLLIYTFLIMVVIVLVFVRLQQKGGGKQLVLQIISLVFVLAIVVSLFKSNNATPVIFSFFPAAVFLTNYIESIKKMRLREVIIIICIALPLLLFLLELNK
ncbi:DUF6427 family protein [Flagellimonas sp. HMM57]|uniref:DUF6427 family protein n=1 Tax=unclassified Flagellimonas TaxID=2644544 RepID=UPI0013D1F386|nr:MULTISPECIES: DUF6427 family protein [unclassified Flagellimonas]UII77590.1 DUF6427 family protein [Flagellimonas sp. HMM57]